MHSIIYTISVLLGVLLILTMFIYYDMFKVGKKKTVERFMIETEASEASAASEAVDQEQLEGLTGLAMVALGNSEAVPEAIDESAQLQGLTNLAMVALGNAGKSNADTLTIPARDSKFMLLTTFNNTRQLSNNQSRWYDIDVNLTDIRMDDNNHNQFFSINNAITFSRDNVFDYLEGVNMKGVQLTGPISMNFSDRSINNVYSLTNFSAVFMMKINSIQRSSKLLEILCNTSSAGIENGYMANAISIKIERKQGIRHIDIKIMFGTESYHIKDLDIKLFVNHSIMLVALTFDSKHINLYINSMLYRFNHNEAQNITLGTQPLIINKHGELDCVMYSVAYYKKCLSFHELSLFKKFMYHHLSGADALVDSNRDIHSKLIEEKEEADRNRESLESVSNLLDKCVIADNTATPTEHQAHVSLPRTEIVLQHVNELKTPYPSLLQLV